MDAGEGAGERKLSGCRSGRKHGELERRTRAIQGWEWRRSRGAREWGRETQAGGKERREIKFGKEWEGAALGGRVAGSTEWGEREAAARGKVKGGCKTG